MENVGMTVLRKRPFKMYRLVRCVLEALVLRGPTHKIELEDLSGYKLNSVGPALTFLNLHRLAERCPNRFGAWQATDAGKIYIALVSGKEMRARAAQQLRAA